MSRKGFTLIELVMVIVLLGIMTAFIAPRMPDVTGTNAAAFTDKLRADVRFAQNLAMAENRRYRVYVNAGPAPNPGYAVVNDADTDGTWGEAGEVAIDPAGGGTLSIALNAGQYAGITVALVPAGFIEFDALGRPVSGGAMVTVTPGGTTVTITAQTGAVN